MRRYWTLLLVVSLVWVMGSPVAANADTPRRDILFASDRVDPSSEDVTTFGRDIEIFAMRADGTDIVQLTDDVGTFSNSPDWSPDGRFVTFHRCEIAGPICRIWVMNADGSGALQLTDTPGTLELDPRWSPDGQQILFTSAAGFSPADVFVMDADGSNVRNITNTPTISEQIPDWSPSGREIVYAANVDVVRHNLTTETKTNLTQSSTSLDLTPVWSPDGKKIAFTSLRDGNFFDVYVMDADGSNPVRLTEHPLADYAPQWSRNGQQIYFMSDRDGIVDCSTPFFGFCTQLYVMDADGSNQTPGLVENAAIHRFIIR